MNPDRLRKLLGGGDGHRLDITKVSVGRPEDGADGGQDDGVEAARDIIHAIKTDDPEALDRALEDHYRACQSEEKDGADGDDGHEDGGPDEEYGDGE